MEKEFKGYIGCEDEDQVKKEFKSLSEKRQELFDEVFDKKIEKELFIIFNCIADQVKEAVELLKESKIELTKIIKSKKIKHNNFTEDYKVGYNIAIDLILLLMDGDEEDINKIFGKDLI